MGGVVPGIIMAISLMIMLVFYAKKYNLPRQTVPDFYSCLKGFYRGFITSPYSCYSAWWYLWLGVFTPTEAAAVAVLYALIICVFVMRVLSPKNLVSIFIETAQETAVIGFLVAASSLYGWVFFGLSCGRE